ncbi:alpha-soluble NSF attachment protein [Mytilinidion resinicola]|uniref:Alpha-soluble NSF attachment protein n=1 Tax=Mytilinidion resinicola TaxID=574789 RepID=A0A6A6Y724_9PEZI|nr:alpha-soluble NSF attachment protein [Mytilinidion resinicola]KAF2803607.1 alpha-soluble NSF attachment protein [Mytilinidion resinicola]
MAQDPRVALQKADKALAGAGSGFSFFGGRSDKYENAADLYIQAANAFRMAKQGMEAGRAFEKAGSIQLTNLNEPDDFANTMTEAFKAYRKESPEDAARCLDKAISHYASKGNFRRAATHKQNIAELFEVELQDEGRAAAAYEEAASWYETLANKLWLKTADLVALEGKDYERVAKSSVQNNLMKWSVKEYLLKAGICSLATGDMVGVNAALERYRDLDNSFSQQREHQLLVDLAEACKEGDQEMFADKLFQYDQMSKLDKWKTTILLRIKNSIESVEEDFS